MKAFILLCRLAFHYPLILQQVYVQTWALTDKEAALPTAQAVTPCSQPPLHTLAALAFAKAGNGKAL